MPLDAGKQRRLLELLRKQKTGDPGTPAFPAGTGIGDFAPAVDLPTDLSQLRFGAPVSPAEALSVAPDVGEVRTPQPGLIPPGTTESLMSKIFQPQEPFEEGLSGAEKTRRLIVNFIRGTVKAPVGVAGGLLEDPIETAKGLATFIPEEARRVHRALPDITALSAAGILPRLPQVTEEERKQARAELFEHPEGPVFAAAALTGLAGRVSKIGRKAPKAPEVPATEVAKPTRTIRPITPTRQPGFGVKAPHEMSKREFDVAEGKGMGESWFNAAKLDNGKIVISRRDHGDLIASLENKGLIGAEEKPQYRGWVWNTKDRKSTFIDVADLERSGGDFHRAYINKAIAEGKIKSHPDYPDLTVKKSKPTPTEIKKALEPKVRVKMPEVEPKVPVVKPTEPAKGLSVEAQPPKVKPSKTPITKAEKPTSKMIEDDFVDYYKGISTSPKITVKEAQKRGIALRQTRGGKIKPSVRQSGPFVPVEVAEYKNYKDISHGVFGSKDPTRGIQEIDGALSVAEKAKFPGQAGPMEQAVLWRTRDMVKQKMAWLAEQQTRLKKVVEGVSDKQAEVANRVLEEMSRRAAYVAPEKLAASGPISRITKDVEVIKFAQEARKYFDHVHVAQNRLRKLRNQREIPYVGKYSPHRLQESSLWSEVLNNKKLPAEAMSGPLPDYIKPNKPFIGHDLARQNALPEFAREMNLKTLLERYTGAAAKDIFNTSIIQNNKAFAEQLRTMGKKESARFIDEWTAEAYGGLKGGIDRKAALGKTPTSLMKWWRRALVRGVFPLNFTWNAFVQTSSGVLTNARYGSVNSIAALSDWFLSKKKRAEIAQNTYSFIIKTSREGKISQQDINRGVTSNIRLRKGKIDTAVDAANYFTELVEYHLSGWSAAAALRHGRKAGLKGKGLWEYASDGAAKTQSMYNYEDLPGILRNDIVKTGAPFQTFSFEIWNTMKEFAGVTGTPPATFKNRAGWVIRFLAGASAVNYIGNATIGRKPWEASSFIPFYNMIWGPIVGGKAEQRGLPGPVGVGTQLSDAVRDYVVRGDKRGIRQWAIRYLPSMAGIPGGTQIARTVDGIIAVADGGLKGPDGKLRFPITETKDQIRAIISGPWSTGPGQERLKKFKRSGAFSEIMDEITGKKKPTKEAFPTAVGPSGRTSGRTSDRGGR